MKKKSESTKYLKIGQVSNLINLPASTLRYYEQIGLLPASYTSETKYRYYKEGDINFLIFIKNAKEIGFTLKEIKEIVDCRKQGELVCQKVNELSLKKIKSLESKIKELKSLRNHLETYLSSCSDENIDNQVNSNICKLISKCT